MTRIARQCRGDMSGALARGDCAVMATLALIGGLAVVDGIAWQPVVTGMAGLAEIGGHRMNPRFSARARAIMTIDTTVTGLSVIDGVQRRSPGTERMTGFTHIGGDRMRRRFKGAATDAVMAAHTGTGATGLCVRERYCQAGPDIGVMTGFTQVAGGRMGGALTRGGTAVVTPLATVRRLAVIDRCQWYPVVAVMTGLAQVAGDRMGGRFKRTPTHAVMTSGTGTGLARHCAVIECSAQPGGSAVAHIAGRGRGHMGRALARGRGAVMAVGTGIRGLRMIKRNDHWQPGRIAMAGFAHIAAQRMVPRFKGAATHPIMTATAGTSCRGLAVIKRRDDTQEAGGHMAGFAEIAGQRMGGRFTQRRSAVVTPQTTVRGLSVIERQQGRHPHGGTMTGLAQVAGHRMRYRFKGAATDAVMAAHTGAGTAGLRMRERCAQGGPEAAVMAGVTLVRGQRMRRVLARRCGAIMTTGTGVCGLIVRKRYHQRSPHRGGVTGLAQVGGDRMGG